MTNMNECTIGTMKTRCRTNQKHDNGLENVAFSSTDDLIAILKYHTIDECLLMYRVTQI